MALTNQVKNRLMQEAKDRDQQLGYDRPVPTYVQHMAWYDVLVQAYKQGGEDRVQEVLRYTWRRPEDVVLGHWLAEVGG